MIKDKLQPFMGEEHQPFHLEGEQQAALLVHGFPGTPAEMRPVADVLHGLGWTVRGILLPGFGSEFEQIRDYTYSDWIAAIETNLLELRQTYERVILVGYSLGGALSIKVAASMGVDGLILFSPFTEIKHFLWHALPMIRMVVPKIKIFKLFKPDFGDPQVREGIHNFMPGADLDDLEVREQIVNFELPIAMFNEIRTAGQQASEVADNITVPTLVLQGANDDLVQPDSTRQLIARFSTAVEYIKVSADHNLIDPSLPAWSILVDALQSFVGESMVEG